jgi:hypothetical protein
MNEINEKRPFRANPDGSPQSLLGPSNQSDSPSRRELIERYGKYAVVAGPLLVFVSRAQAIHSRP